MNPESIGQRIHKIRFDAGLTQSDFCQIVDHNQSNFSKIEQGRRLPTIELLLAIAENFKVNLNWILTGEDLPEKSPDELIQEDHFRINSDDLAARFRSLDQRIREVERRLNPSK